MGLSPDHAKSLYDHASGDREIRVLDVATGQSATLPRHSRSPVFCPHLSPGGAACGRGARCALC